MLTFCRVFEKVFKVFLLREYMPEQSQITWVYVLLRFVYFLYLRFWSTSVWTNSFQKHVWICLQNVFSQWPFLSLNYQRDHELVKELACSTCGSELSKREQGFFTGGVRIFEVRIKNVDTTSSNKHDAQWRAQKWSSPFLASRTKFWRSLICDGTPKRRRNFSGRS